MTRLKRAFQLSLISFLSPALLLFLTLARTDAGEPVVEAEDLRPGLVTTYRDAAPTAIVEITRLEPTIALALKSGESAHPRLTAGGTVHWQGYVNLLRAGDYQFSAKLRGKFRLVIAGKDVLAAEVKEETPRLEKGPTTHLEGGIHRLKAEFTRLLGVARVELFWQAPQFRTEPLPFNQLGHLAAEESERLKTDQLVERGRFLAEENNCARCHQPADDDRVARGLLARQAPDLSQVGQRAYPGWLYHWLGSPQKVRPGAAMPRLFTDDEAGRVERYAVTRYLASLGGPLKADAKQPRPEEMKRSLARGERLFASIGCIVCHRTEKASEPVNRSVRSFPLFGLGSKTTPDHLAPYLANPLAVDPSGRMPNMVLHGDEPRDLARYLCQSRDAAVEAGLPAAPSAQQVLAAFRRVEPRAEEVAAFRPLRTEAQCLDLGKRLVIAKRCNSCHTIAPSGKPFANLPAVAAFADIKQPQVHAAGCLADDPHKRGQAPSFGFEAEDRKALCLFLRQGTAGAGSPAPAYAARVALDRFNCLACHSRDGVGGLTPDLVEQLRKFERVENGEAVNPPPLTGAAQRLHTPWLRTVLTGGGRARPWMGLRMPQFGEANVGGLPEALAALEGTEPDSKVHQVPLTAANVAAGRQLVGKSGLGCISCHDIAGIANSGTRGPDLASMDQRVRYEWYRRWLEQPQRLQPGTRMPTIFPDGKSLFANILDGNADAQADALWAYLSLGKNLPLPEGLEPPKGLILAVKDRPMLLRTFMPDAGARALAVGYPGGVSLAFDAATCRLAYAWSGNFLDASPVWDGRGGSPAHVLGLRFWTAPAGCPWDTSASSEPPNFTAHAADPAYGAQPPEGKLYTGPRRLWFEGYATDKQGLPVFRYRLLTEEGHALEVSERPGPLHGAVAVGLARRFTLGVPAQATPWCLAGQSTHTPRVLDPKGSPLTVDWKSGRVEVVAPGRLLVLPQDNGRVVLLDLASAPKGTHWSLRRVSGTWQALLRLPASAEAMKVNVALNVWVLPREEPALLRALIQGLSPGGGGSR
jgi:mono/diheme cytochrome c family protein